MWLVSDRDIALFLSYFFRPKSSSRHAPTCAQSYRPLDQGQLKRRSSAAEASGEALEEQRRRLWEALRVDEGCNGTMFSTFASRHEPLASEHSSESDV